MKREEKVVWLFLIATLFLILLFYLRGKMDTWVKEGSCGSDLACDAWVEEQVSLYKRKMLISFVLCFALMAVSAIGNGWFALLGIFLACNNGIKKHLFSKLIPDCRKSSFTLYLRRLCFISIVYWGSCAVVLLVAFLMDAGMTLMNRMLIVMAGIYLLVCCSYFLAERKRYLTVVRKISTVKKVFVTVLCFALVMYLGMAKGCLRLQFKVWNTLPVAHEKNEISYDRSDGSYEITMGREEFKILQLTDIHLGGSVFTYQTDEMALDTVYALIENTRPDLVIITGDLVYPVGLFSMSLNNEMPLMQLSAFMNRIGIPWAFVYGNHDTETIATKSAKELEDIFSAYAWSNKNGTLLFTTTQPPITGRNNQLIKIMNRAGGINQALILLDSNAYESDRVSRYDYVHDDQVAWYKEQVQTLSKKEGGTISSMVFLHIPLQEYEEAYHLYQKGSDQVTYYFGEVAEGKGEICASKHESTLFDTAVELGSTKAFFCGHDHYNNICLGYKNIKLTYGMSIDYLAMPGIAKKTKQRGGTLITLYEDQTFDIMQIPFASIQNK